MAVHAFVMRADPSCTRRKAVVSRHNSIYTPDNTIAIVCNRVVGHADKGNSYHNGVVRHHNAVVIVCNRVVRHADEGNSYNKRVVTHHNTIVIACNRICTLAGKEKTIVDGGAGGVGLRCANHDLRRGWAWVPMADGLSSGVEFTPTTRHCPSNSHCPRGEFRVVSRFQPSCQRPSCATIHTSTYIHEVRHGNADDSGFQQR